jgi:hypothetical protein
MKRIVPAAVVAIAANIAMLAAARVNRAGGPEATIRVTERELRLAPASDRDSMRRLHLAVAAATYATTSFDDWLTDSKLAELGIDCGAARRRAGDRSVTACGLSRRAFVALEFDGPSWTARIERLRRHLALETSPTRDADWQAKTLQVELSGGSRLVAVDAALDAGVLRAAHPDRSRYMILPAVVTATADVETRGSKPSVHGRIWPVTTSLVAPGRYSGLLSKLGSSRYPLNGAPRYSVTLAVGRRYEPWIVSIDPIDSTPPRP